MSRPQLHKREELRANSQVGTNSHKARAKAEPSHVVALGTAPSCMARRPSCSLLACGLAHNNSNSQGKDCRTSEISTGLASPIAPSAKQPGWGPQKNPLTPTPATRCLRVGRPESAKPATWECSHIPAAGCSATSKALAMSCGWGGGASKIGCAD